MNERIYELLTEAGGQYGGENHLTGKTRVYTDDVDYEKFAELMVRECADVVKYYHSRNESVTPGQILQHFGVQE